VNTTHQIGSVVSDSSAHPFPSHHSSPISHSSTSRLFLSLKPTSSSDSTSINLLFLFLNLALRLRSASQRNPPLRLEILTRSAHSFTVPLQSHRPVHSFTRFLYCHPRSLVHGIIGYIHQQRTHTLSRSFRVSKSTHCSSSSFQASGSIVSVIVLRIPQIGLKVRSARHKSAVNIVHQMQRLSWSLVIARPTLHQSLVSTRFQGNLNSPYTTATPVFLPFDRTNTPLKSDHTSYRYNHG
jgi:hypothetical protein